MRLQLIVALARRQSKRQARRGCFYKPVDVAQAQASILLTSCLVCPAIVARHHPPLLLLPLTLPPHTHYHLLSCFHKHCLVSGTTDRTYPPPPHSQLSSPTWILSTRPLRTACRARLRATRSPPTALVSSASFPSNCNHYSPANDPQVSSASTHGSSPSPAPCALATQKPKNGSRSWTQTRVDWRSSHVAMSVLASPSHPTTQSHTASGPQAPFVHT